MSLWGEGRRERRLGVGRGSLRRSCRLIRRIERPSDAKIEIMLASTELNDFLDVEHRPSIPMRKQQPIAIPRTSTADAQTRHLLQTTLLGPKDRHNDGMALRAVSSPKSTSTNIRLCRSDILGSRRNFISSLRLNFRLHALSPLGPTILQSTWRQRMDRIVLPLSG